MRDFLKKAGLLILQALLWATGGALILRALSRRANEAPDITGEAIGGDKGKAKAARALADEIEGRR